METVFFDTNSINDQKSYTRLFGKRASLERAAHHYKIVIPLVVYDELVEHKRKQFEDEKKQLAKSGLLKMLHIDRGSIQALVFPSDVCSGFEEENIPYELFEPENYDEFVKRYYPAAISHKAPFEEKSDKGFKDALIAFSIEEYIKTTGDGDPVFLVTADKRLREFFKESGRVIAYETVEELPGLYAEEETGQNPQEESSIEEAASSTLSYEEATKLDDAVVDLCKSNSFSFTHSAVERIMPFREHLSVDQKKKILRASVENSQITWLLGDPDVKRLMTPIFQKYQASLTDREYGIFVDAAGIPFDRLDEDGSVRFSRIERTRYRDFADGLIKHIDSRDWDSSINSDADELLKKLRDLLSRGSLDSKSLTWRAIAGLFVSGGVSADSSLAPIDTVSSFVGFLSECGIRKRDVIISSIADRLELIETDIPF